MAVFTYFGKKIIPAPIVTVNKSYTRTSDNTPISVLYDINAKGTLLPNRGSPVSTGNLKKSDNRYLDAFDSGVAKPDEAWETDDDKFTSLLRKKEQLRALFSNKGKELSWENNIVSTMVQRCYPEVKSINFSDKIYVDRLDYDINFEANRLIIGGGGVDPSDVVEDDLGEFHEYNIVSASDSFSLEENTDFSSSATLYKFVRTVSATSKFRFEENSSSNLFDPPATGEIASNTAPAHTAFDADTEAWQLARLWVQNRIGSSAYGIDLPMSTILATGVIGGDVTLDTVGTTPATHSYNRKRLETVDRIGGSYSIKESWDLSDDNHVIKMNVKHEIINPDLSGTANLNRYTVSGNVIGLRDAAFGTGSKLTNAINGYEANVLKAPTNRYDNLIAEINSATGLSLAISDTGAPVTEFKSVDTSNGIISFSFVFEDNGLPSNSLFKKVSVNISENHDENIIATIPVPGRVGGPIIQDMATQSSVKRRVDAQFQLKGGRSAYVADIGNIRSSGIVLLKSGNYSVIDNGWTQGTHYWVTSFNDSLNVDTNTFSMNIEFTLAPTGIAPSF